jgi:hypothetical protein
MHYSIQFFKLCTVVLLVFFTACKKDETDMNTINDEDRQTSKEHASSETTFIAVWNMTLEAAQNEPGLNGFVNGVTDRNACPTVTVTPTGTYPKTLTLDYGTGCTTPLGQLISGKIVAVFAGPINNPSTSISISFTDFKYKGNTVQGTYSVSGVSAGSYAGTITGGSITNAQGQTYTYAATINIVQVAGIDTKGPLSQSDDVYEISTNISGTNSSGKAYSAKTISPLRKEIACEWVVSGVVEVKVGNTPKKTLDFGTGQCDDQATLKVGSVTTPITLP